METPVPTSRRTVLAASGALLAQACAGGPTPLVTVNLADTPPPAAGEPAARLETAFDAARRMTVPAWVNGQGPFPFVVDTGANSSVVSVELADALGLPAAGAAPVHGISGVEPAALRQVQRLRVGEVRADHLALPVLPQDKLGGDGILGVDVLHNRRITLDFQRNQFEVGTSGQGYAVQAGRDSRLPDSGAVTVPARYRFGQLVIVNAAVGSVPISAFLDSGAQISVGNLALREALLRAGLVEADRFVQTPLVSATGQVSQGELAVLEDLRLGGLKVPRMTLVFADLHIFDLWRLSRQPTLLIGVDVLRQFDSVVLDFGRREVTFRPPAQARIRAPR